MNTWVCTRLALGIAAGTRAGAAQQPADSTRLPGVRSAVEARAAADSFSGVVLVARGGQAVYQAAFGQANHQREIANTMATRFNLGSGDKLFTKIAIRQLVQAGRLSLDDTLGRFLPEYPNAVARSRVTVAQLLAHRSGIGSYWNAAFRAQRTRLRNLADIVPLFDRDSLMFEPGTQQLYSNGGYVLLGRIVEIVSGMSYYDYVQRNIFEPAGMGRTEYLTLDQWPADRALGYTFEDSTDPGPADPRLAGPGAGPQPVRPGAAQGGPGPAGGPGVGRMDRPMPRPGAVRAPNNWVLPFRGGAAGGGYSTAGDLLRLDTALRDGRLLSPAVSDSIPVRMMTPMGPRVLLANGGTGGANFEFSRVGEYTVIVLSNYDPPSASRLMLEIQRLLAPIAQ